MNCNFKNALLFRTAVAIIGPIVFLGCMQDDLNKDELFCNEIIDNDHYLIKNDYQMYTTRNLKNFLNEQNCIDYEEWLSEELFYRILKRTYYDTLFVTASLPVFSYDTKDENGYNKELLRLVRIDLGSENHNIVVIDLIRSKNTVNYEYVELEFDSTCINPLGSSKGKIFSRICFNEMKRNTDVVNINEWAELWEVMSETDFMNTMYFDTGEISFCEEYSYYFTYNSASNIIDGKREFYRECPGSKSPIFLVSEKILSFVN